jgi:hypothetical protein
MREDLSILLVKQESREAERMLEWSWNESQTKGGLRLQCTNKEGEPIHVYRVTDNTQIGQMSKDTRGTRFRGSGRDVVRGKGIFWKRGAGWMRIGVDK